MRRVEVDDVLSTIPANGLVEICQDAKNADSANDQYIPASVFATAAQGALGSTALQTEDINTFAELDAIVADESLVAVSDIDTLAELNSLISDATLGNSAVVMVPGSGWDSVGVYHSSVEKVGDFYKTTIYVDLAGAKSMTTEDDIIGPDKGADVIVNGTVTGDTDWTYGTGWSYGTNNIDADVSAGGVLTPAVALVAVVGKTYELTYTMSSYSDGACVASFGGEDFTSRGSDATFVERIVATATGTLEFTANAAADYTIDDIILKEVPLAHLGQFTVAKNGTLFDGQITWFETPNGGVTDIDFWMAPEGSGAFDDAGKTDLTEVVVYAKGSAAAGARATQLALAALPAADNYLYMFAGAAGTTGTYDAGIFKLELWGA